MKVIVDTCEWSAAFRKPINNKSKSVIAELTELINEGSIIMLGLIRQELLSGVKSEKDFIRLRDNLRAFDDHAIKEEDYELAAELYNKCRRRGVQGSNTDFLICSVAIRNGFSIFTTDNDFKSFSKYIKIRLHKVRPLIQQDA